MMDHNSVDFIELVMDTATGRGRGLVKQVNLTGHPLHMGQHQKHCGGQSSPHWISFTVSTFEDQLSSTRNLEEEPGGTSASNLSRMFQMKKTSLQPNEVHKSLETVKSGPSFG